MKATAYRKQLSSPRRTQQAYYLEKCVIHVEDFFPLVYSVILCFPTLFSSKQLREEGKQFFWNACMLAKFTKLDFPTPPSSWGLWNGKRQIWQFSARSYLFTPCFGWRTTQCQSWKMHLEGYSCSCFWFPCLHLTKLRVQQVVTFNLKVTTYHCIDTVNLVGHRTNYASLSTEMHISHIFFLLLGGWKSLKLLRGMFSG